jgi:hypothetical protein
VSDRCATMSHPFSSRGTPSRMHYTEAPGSRSVDSGQRSVQSIPYAQPSTLVQVSRLFPAPLPPCSQDVLPTFAASWNPAISPSYTSTQTSWVHGTHNMYNLVPHMKSHIHSIVSYNATPTLDTASPGDGRVNLQIKFT